MEEIKRGQLCPRCGRYNSRQMVINGIVENDGKILLIRRGIEPGYGKWALPGGYLDWDETLQEGVIREVKEETGLQTSIKTFLSFFDSIQRNSQNIAAVFVLHVIGSKEIEIQKEEVLESGWFGLNELPDGVAFDHNLMIEEYRKFLNKEME